MADARDGSPHHSYGPSAPDLHRTEALPSDVPCAYPGCRGFRSGGKYGAGKYCPEHRHRAHDALKERIQAAEERSQAQRARWEAVWDDAKSHADAAHTATVPTQLVITPTGGYFAAAGALGHAWVCVRHAEFGAWLRNQRGAETWFTGGARVPAPEGPLDRQRAWVNAFVSRLQAQGIRAYPDSRIG